MSVATELRRYPDEFLYCNGFRDHHWEDYPDDKRTPYSIEIAQRCTNCGTRKRIWIDWSGRAVSRMYDHPEGYSLDVSRADMRLEYLRRRGVRLKKQKRTSGDGLSTGDRVTAKVIRKR